jgi:RNA polymerase sigma-70 factor (ECF subfamily)
MFFSNSNFLLFNPVFKNKEKKLGKRTVDIHQQLIEKCRRGDSRAQYSLYRQYSKAMYNTAIRLLVNKMDAEDVLQEAFVAAFRKLDDFRGESTFGAWLKCIVINHCINFLKMKKLVFEDIQNHTSAMADGGLNWAEHAFNLEEIHETIKTLPGGARAVFNLFLLEGYKHQEIAAMLNISESTSKSQYQRAKLLMKEKLCGYEK